MPSNCIGEVIIDQLSLSQEFEALWSLQFSDTYKEFICGRWRSCALWNESGTTEDVRIRNYVGRAKKTKAGDALPYINSIIEKNFDMDSLRFCRLVMLEPGSVVLPHRDYLELKNHLVRLHIPLVTDLNCFNSEEQVVHHLSQGEVWYLDASIIHSAGCFSKNTRVHIILDFFECKSLNEIFYNYANEPRTISIENREPLSSEVEDALLGLSSIVNEYNFYDVLAVLAKQHFKTKVPLCDFYYYLEKIADQSGDEWVINKARWLREYCLAERATVE